MEKKSHSRFGRSPQDSAPRLCSRAAPVLRANRKIAILVSRPLRDRYR